MADPTTGQDGKRDQGDRQPGADQTGAGGDQDSGAGYGNNAGAQGEEADGPDTGSDEASSDEQ